MSKVICDVCGTDYPETEPRCPLCDCVRSDGGQTSAGNTEEYTYVKGGRFSKSNVRKRLKASQQVQDTEVAQMPALIPEEKLPENPEPEEPEDDFDEDELEGVSNRGLIMIVILLLVAIIAVSSYLAIVFFGGRDEKEWTKSTTTAGQQSSSSTQKEPGDSEKPCTQLIVSEDPMILGTAGQTNGVKFFVERVPEDTTDAYEFRSNNPEVATVNENGLVMAVGPGETTITVKCGSVEASVVVKCTFEVQTPDDDPTDDPDDNPVEELELKLKYKDVTLDRVYPTLQLYNGNIPRDQIEWTSSKEEVATVEDGLVTPVALGSTKITATYKNQSVTCMIYVSQEALDKLGIGQKPDQPDEPDEPDVPDVPDVPDEPAAPKTYSLKLNGNTPKWQIDGRENTADVSLTVGGSASESSCRLTVVDNEGNNVAVDWKFSDVGYVAYDEESGKFVAVDKGIVTLTASVDGTDFEVKIRVK